MKRITSVLLILAACNGDDTVFGPDASNDASNDATLDSSTKDASNDATTNDAATDASNDVTGDVSSDALHDALGDVVEASTDALEDANDGGSQWNTPTCDGTIGSNEYGGASNSTTSGGQTWYMTWNATNLYVALVNADLSEANVLYVGYSGNGTTSAQTYDQTGGTLPFPADAVLYAKGDTTNDASDTYNEVRLNGDGGVWSVQEQNAITYCSNPNGNVREEVIPWSVMGATSIPSGFRFLAYATSGGGSVYGQLPTTNGSGNIGTSYAFPHDFYVASTANGSGSFPFNTPE